MEVVYIVKKQNLAINSSYILEIVGNLLRQSSPPPTEWSRYAPEKATLIFYILIFYMSKQDPSHTINTLCTQNICKIRSTSIISIKSINIFILINDLQKEFIWAYIYYNVSISYLISSLKTCVNKMCSCCEKFSLEGTNKISSKCCVSIVSTTSK